MYKNTICLAIVQRFGGGFPFFRCFMYVFTRKWAEAADVREGEHRGEIPAEPGGKRRGLFAYSAKNE